MTALKQIDLAKDGLNYVESSLRKGGKGLCLRLLDLPLAQGRTYTILPEPVREGQATRFDVGHGFRIESENWLAKHVVSLAATNVMGTSVFQDVWGARPEDAGFKKKRRSKMFFNQADVYHYVPARALTEKAVATAIKELASHLRIGAFVDVPIDPGKLPDDRFVDDSFIENLARRTQEIYVSAYDQESFVVWKRDG